MLIRKLNDDLRAAARALGYPEDKITVTYSDRPDLCQFQCNGAFALAKELRRAPIQIAQALGEEFSKTYGNSHKNML